MDRVLKTWIIGVAVLVLAVSVAGCDDETTPTTPTAPTAPVTDTFTGVVPPNGASTHSFAVAAAGTVTATLKAVGADNTLVVSFALGNWNGTACSAVLANDAATGGAVLTGTMSGIGNLCTRISDVGNIAQGTTASYTIEVVHP